MTEENKDLGTRGQKNTLKGKMKQATGKVQSKAGEMTGNKEMKAKGDVRQATGKAQSASGTVQRKADQILDPDKPTI